MHECAGDRRIRFRRNKSVEHYAGGIESACVDGGLLEKGRCESNPPLATFRLNNLLAEIMSKSA